MGTFTIEAANREGLMRGSMTLQELEAACTKARVLGCTNDAVPTSVNQPVMSATGGPLISISFEVE